MITATTARLILQRESDNRYSITRLSAMPGSEQSEVSVSVELRGGEGLVRLQGTPSRRDADRAGVDRNRLLMVSLGGSHANDFEAWARRSFDSDVVTAPFDAVSKVQRQSEFGCILLHAQRRNVRDAVQACRAIRPLTRAAIVFASDDAIRSTDRINLLEAGADDCLSGALDFRELGLRIRQAIETGARPLGSGAATAPEPEIPAVVRGPIPLEQFAAELHRRAESPRSSFFCVVAVKGSAASDAALAEGLAELVRAEEGDLVAASDPCLLLLQGARESQLGTFLARLRAREQELAGPAGSGSVEVNLFSHPGHAPEIEELLGTSVGRVE
jgi:CheY-like chemotaxis protein